MVTMENAYMEMFVKEAETQGCENIELLNIEGVKILKVCNADFLMDIMECDDSDHIASCDKIEDMGDIQYGVLLGSEIKKFSKETQEVIMYHEIGHALTYMQVTDKESDMKSELLADLYVVEQTSFEMFENAMLETANYMKGNFEDSVIKEFTNNRINNVKKWLQ